ncbi:MAG: hypothetical protein IKJ81_06765 [Bacteroidales bacterium]|nr:hypothetical protein [Bacteroidales bacterium]
MTRKELLDLVCDMANLSLDCKYPDGRPFNAMKVCINHLKDSCWYNASFGDTSDGSAMLRNGDAEQLKIWLNGVDWSERNDYQIETLSVRVNKPNISIFYAEYSQDKTEPQLLVDCTINTHKSYNLRFRGGRSKNYERLTEWGWTRWGTLNGHKPGETDPYYLNMDYWDDIVDPDVMC